jgi:hypothetical protein
MGCDIHYHVEVPNEQGVWEPYEEAQPFDGRSYALFGWLAGVRNYSAIVPLSEPRGLPEDSTFALSMEDSEYHSLSWLSVSEIQSHLDDIIEDRRYTKVFSGGGSDGGATCEAGQGQTMTVREFLSEYTVAWIERLPKNGRIVFGFDN